MLLSRKLKPDFDFYLLRILICAGSSISAIMGALYCSGHSAEDIKQLAAEIIGRQTNANQNAFFNLDNTPLSWMRMIEINFVTREASAREINNLQP